jgi:predicted transcriptional regulator
MTFIHLKDKGSEEIVAETLGMNELQREIYFTLRDRELTVKELVAETGRTRSVVQRALQELMDRGVVLREGKTERTVYYVYTALPFDKVEEKVAEIIRDWHDEVQDTLS